MTVWSDVIAVAQRAVTRQPWATALGDSPGRQPWGSRGPMTQAPTGRDSSPAPVGRGIRRDSHSQGVALGFRVVALWAKPQTILPIRQRSRHALLRPCQPVPETKAGSREPLPNGRGAVNVSLMTARVAQLASSCMRSIGNQDKASNIHWLVNWPMTSIPNFQCLRHPA